MNTPRYGVVVVCGADARRGRCRGLVLERLRIDGGDELAAGECFERMGGYLTSRPAVGEPMGARAA
jgi:methionyl-tRNA formyltransferase